jgi:hypothetical protein
MGKNQDPGSGINIPDPPHCISLFHIKIFLYFPILQVQREVKFTLGTYVTGSKLYKRKNKTKALLKNERSSSQWQINATHADPDPKNT